MSAIDDGRTTYNLLGSLRRSHSEGGSENCESNFVCQLLAFR